MYSFPGERITSNPTFGFPPVRSVDSPIYGFPQRPKPGILQEMQRVAGKGGNTYVKSVETVDSTFIQTDSVGMALAGNGNIYITPNSSSIAPVLQWNVQNNRITQIAVLTPGATAYTYSCYYEGKIYVNVGGAGKFVVIDTDRLTVTQLTPPDTQFRYSIVASPVTGKIYTAPLTAAGGILEFDPANNTFTTIGSGISGIYGLQPHPNGKIYGLNITSQNVMEFDPATRNISYFGTINNHYHSALGLNGKIYAHSSGTTTILEIDVENRTTSQFGSINQTNNNYFNPLINAPNGKLYSYPYLGRQNGQILEVDVQKRTVSQIGALGLQPGSNGFGGCFGPDGCLYFGAGLPSVVSAVFKRISFSDTQPVNIPVIASSTPDMFTTYSNNPESWSRWALLSPYLNKS